MHVTCIAFYIIYYKCGSTHIKNKCALQYMIAMYYTFMRFKLKWKEREYVISKIDLILGIRINMC